MSNLLTNLPAAILNALMSAFEDSLDGARTRRADSKSAADLFTMPIAVTVTETGQVFGLQPELQAVNPQAYQETVAQYGIIEAFFRQQLTAYRAEMGYRGDIVFAANANIDPVENSKFHGQPTVLVNVYHQPRILSPKERLMAKRAAGTPASSTRTILPRAGSIQPALPSTGSSQS